MSPLGLSRSVHTGSPNCPVRPPLLGPHPQWRPPLTLDFVPFRFPFGTRFLTLCFCEEHVTLSYHAAAALVPGQVLIGFFFSASFCCSRLRIGPCWHCCSRPVHCVLNLGY